MIHFTKFFTKQFHRKFFPGLSQKIFPTNATNARFAIFQKSRIAPFARIPASNPHFMQPTLKNEKNTPSFHSGRAQPIRQTIARPKGPIRAFFRARFMPKPATRGATPDTGSSRLHNPSNPATSRPMFPHNSKTKPKTSVSVKGSHPNPKRAERITYQQPLR